MSFKTGFVTYLNSKTSITNLVGDRIYDQVAPESASFPYITFQVISGDKIHHTTGQSDGASILLQINSVATSGLQCETINEALRNVLNGFHGSFGAEYIYSCYFQSELDDYSEPKHGQDVGTFARISNYSLLYKETIPTL